MTALELVLNADAADLGAADSPTRAAWMLSFQNALAIHLRITASRLLIMRVLTGSVAVLVALVDAPIYESEPSAAEAAAQMLQEVAASNDESSPSASLLLAGYTILSAIAAEPLSSPPPISLGTNEAGGADETNGWLLTAYVTAAVLGSAIFGRVFLVIRDSWKRVVEASKRGRRHSSVVLDINAPVPPPPTGLPTRPLSARTSTRVGIRAGVGSGIGSGISRLRVKHEPLPELSFADPSLVDALYDPAAPVPPAPPWQSPGHCQALAAAFETSFNEAFSVGEEGSGSTTDKGGSGSPIHGASG